MTFRFYSCGLSGTGKSLTEDGWVGGKQSLLQPPMHAFLKPDLNFMWS